MTIDGVDISAFHAVLSDFPDIQPATVVTYSDWLRQAINPLYYGAKETYKVIKLTFFIKDTDYQSCLCDVSNLCNALKKCMIKFDDISYYYDCALSATPVSAVKIRDNRLSVTVTLNSAYAYLPAVTTTLSGTSQTLPAQGNLPSPATITLTPSQDIGTLTLSGLTKKPVTISNLHAGAPVVIDGEKCTVTEADLDTVLTQTGGSGYWMFRKYSIALDPDSTRIYMVPEKSMIPTGAAYTQQLIADAATLYHGQGGYDYLGHIKTAVYVTAAKSITIKFLHDDGVNVFVDGTNVYSKNCPENNTAQWAGYPSVSVPLTIGWHTIEFLWLQHVGDDGIWGLTPTISSQVEKLNCYYARDAGNGLVNKFPDTDLWAFPTIQPGDNAVMVDSSVCSETISYKPKFM
jgi:phage-related protein